MFWKSTLRKTNGYTLDDMPGKFKLDKIYERTKMQLALSVTQCYNEHKYDKVIDSQHMTSLTTILMKRASKKLGYHWLRVVRSAYKGALLHCLSSNIAAEDVIILQSFYFAHFRYPMENKDKTKGLCSKDSCAPQGI